MLRTVTRAIALTALALAAAATLAARGGQPPPAAPHVAPPVALVHAWVLDVRDGHVTPDATVVLRNGRIESVGTRPAPDGMPTVDLRGTYLLPGLIDAHTHLSTFDEARRALESGVTTIRSAGVSNYADVGLRELARSGAIPGPDVLAAGYHVRPHLAPEAFLNDPQYAWLMPGVGTIARLRAAVRMNLSHHVDWIKVLATERAGTADTDPRVQTYTEPELRAVVEEAATQGRYVLAHAHGDEGARAAVEAGVRSIEHGTYLSDATLELMKEKGTYFDPTYTVVIDLAEPGGDYDLPALQIRAQHMLPRLRRTVRDAHRIGVRIVTGSDTGYGPNSLTRIPEEIVNLTTMGLSPLEAIQAATTVNAEMLQLDREIGQVAPGFQADLIAVDGNPLTDIDTIEDVLLVVSNGHVALNRLDFRKHEGATGP
ncbi:MAG: amidohydrolase family protein [Acidobacteriota bacterium]|nr:amidohydrolase family protein [Acidobacteriota bacterium]